MRIAKEDILFWSGIALMILGVGTPAAVVLFHSTATEETRQMWYDYVGICSIVGLIAFVVGFCSTVCGYISRDMRRLRKGRSPSA